jgi:hypothetical protein
VDPFRPGRNPLAELTESLVQSYCRYAREHVDEAGGWERIREDFAPDGRRRLTRPWPPVNPTGGSRCPALPAMSVCGG